MKTAQSHWIHCSAHTVWNQSSTAITCQVTKSVCRDYNNFGLHVQLVEEYVMSIKFKEKVFDKTHKSWVSQGLKFGDISLERIEKFFRFSIQNDPWFCGTDYCMPTCTVTIVWYDGNMSNCTWSSVRHSKSNCFWVVSHPKL